jgi:hypothetical protein
MDASQNLLPPNHTKCSRGICITSRNKLTKHCTSLPLFIFHAWIMPRFCNNKAVGNYEARGKAIGI